MNMPRSVRVHQLEDLSNDECRNEIILETSLNTELHITRECSETIIRLPFGNKFDIIDNVIVIKDIHKKSGH